MNIPLDVPTGSQFYKRLLEALGEADFPVTQQCVATLLGVSQASVSKWRNDKAYPSRAVAARAANLCKVGLSWLYFGTGAKRATDVDERTWRLHQAFETLGEAEQMELIAFAEYKAAQAPNKPVPPSSNGQQKDDDA